MEINWLFAAFMAGYLFFIVLGLAQIVKERRP